MEIWETLINILGHDDSGGGNGRGGCANDNCGYLQSCRPYRINPVLLVSLPDVVQDRAFGEAFEINEIFSVLREFLHVNILLCA